MSFTTQYEQSITPPPPTGAGYESIYPKSDGIWYRLDHAGVERPLGYGGVRSGTATVDFGAVPGNQIATVVVTGLTALLSTSTVSAFIPAEASADHNALEHSVVPMKVTCGTIVAGTGFTITCISDWTLTGRFTIRFTYVV